MALKVSESAKLAYYRRNLKLFRPSRAPLGPLGGQIGPPDGAHMQVKWPLGPSDFVSFRPKAQFDRPDGHFTSI